MNIASRKYLPSGGGMASQSRRRNWDAGAGDQARLPVIPAPRDRAGSAFAKGRFYKESRDLSRRSSWTVSAAP